MIKDYIEETYKDNTDVSGMKKINKKFYMTTMAQSVSVLSETIM